MDLVKLGKSGQVSLPRRLLKRLGIEPGAMLLAEATPDGGILLRPAGVYPIEIYSEDRLSEFAEEDRLSADEAARISKQRRRK